MPVQAPDNDGDVQTVTAAINYSESGARGGVSIASRVDSCNSAIRQMKSTQGRMPSINNLSQESVLVHAYGSGGVEVAEHYEFSAKSNLVPNHPRSVLQRKFALWPTIFVTGNVAAGARSNLLTTAAIDTAANVVVDAFGEIT